MPELVAGIKHLRDGIEAQSVLGSDMSTIAIVGTAPGADASIFPLNRVVKVSTNDTDLRTGLGTEGTLVDALAGISAQLTSGTSAARTILVRVADDADVDTVIAAIVGDETAKTGVWALLDAPEELAITPRLIIAPGYTSQTNSGPTKVTITNGGSGYTSAPTLGFTGGAGTGFAATAVVEDGVITEINVTDFGSGYTSAPTMSVTGGDGTGGAGTVVYGSYTNPICAIMPTICARLKGKFLPEGPVDTHQNATNWLETLPQDATILHPLEQDAQVTVDGEIVSKPLSPYIIALYARVDGENDGVPTKSIANQQVFGLSGITPRIPFSITDENSLGQERIGYSFGIVARGELGVDGAIADGGYIFWGTDTLAAESEWLFANVNRMRDYLELLQVKAIRVYLGKHNITSQTVQAVVNTIEEQASVLRANNHLLDYRVGFDPDANIPGELRLGHLDLTFKGEEPPVLRKVIIRSRRHAEALEALAQTISIQLASQVV